MRIEMKFPSGKDFERLISEMDKKVSTRLLRDAGRRAMAIVQEDMQQNAGYDELSGGPHMRDTIKIRSSTNAAKSERYGTLITFRVGPSKAHHMKALAQEFGVARMTIRKALALLVSWGLVEVLRQQGKEVQSKVLQFEVMPAPPAIASQLRIQVDERIYFSRRVRYVDGKPLMLEDSFMPVKLFRNLSLAHLEGSKFDYIEKECGITISGNYESLTPVLADKQLAGYMNVPEQTPLLRITSLSYSDSGEFLNYSVMFRNTSDYQVDYHLRRIHPEDLLAHPPEQHRQ